MPDASRIQRAIRQTSSLVARGSHRCARAFVRVGLLPQAMLARGLHVRQFPPNYAYHGHFSADDTIVDIGTGDDPDFSRGLIQRYGCTAYCVDPTRKHAAHLAQLAAADPAYHFLPLAVGARNGTATFYESTVNMSGSVCASHRNVRQDPTVAYAVEVVELATLLQRIGCPSIAMLKMDIEGAEYAVLQAVTRETLRSIRQLLVEFHHETVPEYAWRDTRRIIHRLRTLGMRALVFNGRDCLFDWPKTATP